MADGIGPRLRPRLFVEKTYHSYYDPMRGIRTNRWKYIRNFETGLGIEIPSDIAGSGAYRDVAGRMNPSHHVEVELYDLAGRSQ